MLLTVDQLAIGFRRKDCGAQTSGSFKDCSCESTERVVSGGANTDHAIRETRPLNDRTWRVACRDPYNNVEYCHRMYIVCARVQ